MRAFRLEILCCLGIKAYAEAAKSYHQSRKKRRRRQLLRLRGDEYLSGFRKEDRLIPVVTLVIYYGLNEWDAPLSIHDMLLVKDKRLLHYIPDYRTNLITPKNISDEDIDKFESGFGELMLFIKYSQDKQKLQKLLDENSQFHYLDRDTANLINVLTNSTLTFTKENGGIDMCKAIMDIRAEGVSEGMAAGRAEGMAAGVTAGKAEYQKQITRLSSAMKEDLRETELIDALLHPEKLPSLFQKYNIQ